MVVNANVFACLETGYTGNRDAIAIQTPKRSYRWHEIDEGSARYANFLTQLGLPAGARIVVQTEKSPGALMFYLAVLRAGMVYVPLNTAYREAEVGYFLHDAEPSLFVCANDAPSWLTTLTESAGVAHVYCLDEAGEGSLADAAAGMSTDFAAVQRAPDDLAALLYTSGTTGRSKGAMLTHENLASNAKVLKDYWQWTSDDVLLHMLPMFHVHGLFVGAHGALLAGARMIWLPKFDVAHALQHLPESTVMMGVPTYYVRLLADPRFTSEVCANMRLFISGSAPLLAETFKQFKMRTGFTILERYGMSETVMLTSNPYDESHGKRIAGTVGQPLPGVELRIVDNNNVHVPPGQIGHIQVKGPNVFSGYWRMPEKTQEEFTDDGWFKTGDLGQFGGADADGTSDDARIPDTYVSIVGRSKDLIISGGFNVYPKEIESVIDDMPDVAESAVIGVPHPDFGEVVIAIVVPQSGKRLQSGEIERRLKLQVANFKAPKHVHVVDELPRNTMGKVQKNALREQYKLR